MTISAADDRARKAGSSERRPITVLFADIAGSTSIAERLDPEDWTTLVGEAFQRMNRTIERYGGTIARLLGDGVLAFFGAPTAHEDDPERAVRCGLDLVQAIDELDASNHLSGADRLQVRVGINTGPVVVGMVGTETASEYTAMGDTVNVAARMQATARPGSVLITAATHRFVSKLVDGRSRLAAPPARGAFPNRQSRAGSRRVHSWRTRDGEEPPARGTSHKP